MAGDEAAEMRLEGAEAVDAGGSEVSLELKPTRDVGRVGGDLGGAHARGTLAKESDEAAEHGRLGVASETALGV